MNSATETVFSFILGLVLASGIILHFSLGSHTPVPVFDARAFTLAFIAIAVIAVGGAGVFAASATARVRRYRKSLPRCSHGIAGADLKQRCKRCEDDRVAADRLLKVREQQHQLRAAANDLQIHERNRLNAILVPGILQLGGLGSDARGFPETERAPIKLIDGKELLRRMFDSVKRRHQDDRYRSVCFSCGDIVEHHLRNSEEVRCKNGHKVAPSLTPDDVLQISPGGPRPICIECGAPMRLVEIKTGIFWGCSRYPACRSAQKIAKPSRRGKDSHPTGLSAGNLQPLYRPTAMGDAPPAK